MAIVPDMADADVNIILNSQTPIKFQKFSENSLASAHGLFAKFELNEGVGDNSRLSNKLSENRDINFKIF